MAKKAADAPTNRPLGPDCRVVLLHGPEAFLRLRYTQELRDRLKEQHAELDVATFDGASANAAEILDECRSMGLLCGHKMVIVDEADQAVKESSRPLFERYVQGAIDGHAGGATLVLRARTWHKGNLDKLIDKAGVIIACEELTPEKAAAWVTARAKKAYGAAFENDAARLLVDRVGVGLGRLDAEAGKLASAAGGGAVTAALVGEFVGQSREEQVWDIQASMLSGDPGRALEHLRRLLDVSRHPPTLVSYALTDLARKLHGASRGLRQGANAWDLGKSLKLWGPSRDAILDAAKRLPPERALAMLRFCVDADLRQKRGLGESGRTLERMTLVLSGRGGA